jgi:hypothetical protein
MSTIILGENNFKSEEPILGDILFLIFWRNFYKAQNRTLRCYISPMWALAREKLEVKGQIVCPIFWLITTRLGIMK